MSGPKLRHWPVRMRHYYPRAYWIVLAAVPLIAWGCL